MTPSGQGRCSGLEKVVSMGGSTAWGRLANELSVSTPLSRSGAVRAIYRVVQTLKIKGSKLNHENPSKEDIEVVRLNILLRVQTTGCERGELWFSYWE
jgi:hypothetical protein